MATTTLGVFDDPAAARRAMDDLRASPMDLGDISIVARGEGGDRDHLGAGEGAAVGAVWGGLVGLAALLIPGVGPFVAGGALFAALTGAATGAVVGGIAGALMDTGLGEEEARAYETMVHECKTLVAVKSREEDAAEVRRIMAQAGANSLRDNQTDITGTDRPVNVDSDITAGDGLEYGAPGARGGSDVPTALPPTPRPAVVGTAGVYNVPERRMATGVRGIYDTPPSPGSSDRLDAGRETTNMAAGSEDPYGTDEAAAGDEGKAILAEGWDRVGNYGDRRGEELDEPGDAEEATRRRP
jgi:uncharacterized membrane protein